MALVKDHLAYSYGEEFSPPFGFDDYQKAAVNHDVAPFGTFVTKHSASFHEDDQSPARYRMQPGGVYDGITHGYGGSFLNFKQNDSYHWNDGLSQNSSANWLYAGSADTLHDTSMTKRSHKGEGTHRAKKQCSDSSANRKTKPTVDSPSKDPQSIAAKQRRERISERLKILQELVPNGSKVDLVTMLEKAISYVKFLQLQVKVLATDEFWPAQGGKAPDISQVKEAIDAILSSQRTSNTCSSSK